MTDENTAEKLHSHLSDQKYVMVATVSGTGQIVNRPMTVQAVDGWRVRFLTEADNSLVSASEGKSVNLSFTDGGVFVSLTGTGSVSRDVAEKKEIWDRQAEAYAGSPEDPDIVIVQVQVGQGAYWDHGNALTRAAGAVRTAVAGEPAKKSHASVTL